MKFPHRIIHAPLVPMLSHLLVERVRCLFERWGSELGLLWGSGGVSFRRGRGREVQTWGWWRRGARSSLEGEWENESPSVWFLYFPRSCDPCGFSCSGYSSIFPAIYLYQLAVSMSAVSVILFPAQQSSTGLNILVCCVEKLQKTTWSK